MRLALITFAARDALWGTFRIVQRFRLRKDPRHDICKGLNRAHHTIRVYIDDSLKSNGRFALRK